jgi:hypothetical protein
MMVSEEALEHERMIQAFARAMRAERKGAFDQMGFRGRWIVWWDLEAAPALREHGAALWREREFVLKCLGLVLGFLSLAVAVWKLQQP